MSQIIKVSSCELTFVTTERQVGVPDVSGMLVPAVAETNDVVEVCPGEVVLGRMLRQVELASCLASCLTW